MNPADAVEALENLPWGVMVVDGTGRVVMVNAASEQLLGPVVGKRCCELFACHTPDGPCGAACLTEYVAEHREALPETRIDLPASAPAEALWLTAAPRPGRGGVLVLVRRAAAHDGRRRWEVTPGDPSILWIDTLGTMRIHAGDRDIGGDWLRHRPGQLLKYLVCRRGETVTADELGEALWPEGDARSAAAIRHFVHVVRERLEPGRRPRAPSSFILSRGGGYAIDVDRVRIDAERFEHHVTAGAEAFLDDEPEVAQRALEHGLDLYRGDFLEDERYAEWVLRERDRLRHLASQGCRMLAQLAMRSGDLQRAVDRVERLAQLDPFDDEVHQALLILYLRCGRRSDALRRFARIRAQSRQTFGHEPSFDLAELVEMASVDDASLLRLA